MIKFLISMQYDSTDDFNHSEAWKGLKDVLTVGDQMFAAQNWLEEQGIEHHYEYTITQLNYLYLSKRYNYFLCIPDNNDGLLFKMWFSKDDFLLYYEYV